VKVAAAIVLALLVLAGGAVAWLWAPWDEGGAPVELDALAEEFRGSSCRRLAGVAAGLAEDDRSRSSASSAAAPRGSGPRRVASATSPAEGAT
jgi:hypothetical protein